MDDNTYASVREMTRLILEDAGFEADENHYEIAINYFNSNECTLPDAHTIIQLATVAHIAFENEIVTDNDSSDDTSNTSYNTDDDVEDDIEEDNTTISDGRNENNSDSDDMPTIEDINYNPSLENILNTYTNTFGTNSRNPIGPIRLNYGSGNGISVIDRIVLDNPININPYPNGFFNSTMTLNIVPQRLDTGVEMEDVKKVISDIESIPLVMYKNDCNPNKNNECFICYDQYVDTDLVRVLQCGHGFHRSCIDHNLTKETHLCPYCKSPAGKYVLSNI